MSEEVSSYCQPVHGCIGAGTTARRAYQQLHVLLRTEQPRGECLVGVELKLLVGFNTTKLNIFLFV